MRQFGETPTDCLEAADGLKNNRREPYAFKMHTPARAGRIPWASSPLERQTTLSSSSAADKQIKGDNQTVL